MGLSTRSVELMLVIALLIQFSACADVSSSETQISNSTGSEGQRREKFLSLFSIVRFPNSLCLASNSYNGTCLTTAECSAKGGTASGTCASGFGVCCVLTIQTCGATTSLNNTYWQNNGFSSAYTTAGQCSLFVSRASSDVDQLRLEFITFILAQPDSATLSTTGQCITDSFTVSGSANIVPAICGSNTNQHMYINIGPGTSTVTLSIITSGTAMSRYWNIRVIQIPENTDYTAPDNCLQWFTEASGRLVSFNYQYATTPIVQHLAYQDYTMCIRTNQGFCGVKYDLCTPTASNPYGLSTVAAGTVATGTLMDSSCVYDWLQIPCVSDQANSVVTSVGATVGCASKLCGITGFTVTADSTTATTSLYSYRRPFEVRFYTDSKEFLVTAADAENWGFCLTYTQQPCLSSATNG
ncbi:uncharacterized protein LOC116917689 [Daphnia magna]|uniref:CUB domain-containing protein n=1 Tax=Daphnia magna TaxID=35525 RepID=A0A0P6FAX6_9CRUS|nr:uncharacterized protein LOC116917689 [Daphnia magna]